MKTFGMKTVIHFGDNALDRLREIPYKRVLIITDPFVVQSKMIDLITEPLAKGGIEYDIFSNVVPDAPVDKIADGVKKFLSYQPEAVIAVGGGSAIDSSKAIREVALKILSLIHIYSKNVDNITKYAKAIDTAILVKNGPSYSALGFGGEGYCTFLSLIHIFKYNSVFLSTNCQSLIIDRKCRIVTMPQNLYTWMRHGIQISTCIFLHASALIILRMHTRNRIIQFSCLLYTSILLRGRQ